MMPMSDKLKDPSKKYRRFTFPNLKDRRWPSNSIENVPRWLSTDLRDGNQALVNPMTSAQKLVFFQMLLDLGYKEIEISFPSASQTDFDFTRQLVETPRLVPDDVWLQVLSPCRIENIRRTVESIEGANKAIIHLYLATSPCFQKLVLGMSPEDMIDLAIKCTKYARSITKDDPRQSRTLWSCAFALEFFSDSEPTFVLRLCEAVKSAWGPTTDTPIIFNLPATVEMATPNIYADQVEMFSRNISDRDTVCVSLHTHNDRGCAVAATELGLMAGADRVEGTLFGNGERTGNVDLVTLSYNMLNRGLDPGVDLSDLDRIIAIVEETTQIPVAERSPYAGRLARRAEGSVPTDSPMSSPTDSEANSQVDSQTSSQTEQTEFQMGVPVNPEKFTLAEPPDDVGSGP